MFPETVVEGEWEELSRSPNAPARESISMGEASTYAKKGSAQKVLSDSSQWNECGQNISFYKTSSPALLEEAKSQVVAGSWSEDEESEGEDAWSEKVSRSRHDHDEH